MNAKRLGEYIKLRRDELNMTQEELAEKVGTVQGYLTQIETGRKIPSYDLLLDLSTALKVPGVFLFGVLTGSFPQDANLSDLGVLNESRWINVENLNKLPPVVLRTISSIIRGELEYQDMVDKAKSGKEQSPERRRPTVEEFEKDLQRSAEKLPDMPTKPNRRNRGDAESKLEEVQEKQKQQEVKINK